MIKKIISQMRQGCFFFLLMSLFLGGVIPLVFTVTAQLLFPTASQGNVVMRDGKVIGSKLLGQSFTQPHYFWGRLSATTPPYNAAASGASNASFANTKLLEQMNVRLASLRARSDVPIDLVTASGSGLDPHISLDAALFQVERVAKARRISSEKLRTLVEAHLESSVLGFIGMPRVNVLALNLALDRGL